MGQKSENILPNKSETDIEPESLDHRNRRPRGFSSIRLVIFIDYTYKTSQGDQPLGPDGSRSAFGTRVDAMMGAMAPHGFSNIGREGSNQTC